MNLHSESSYIPSISYKSESIATSSSLQRILRRILHNSKQFYTESRFSVPIQRLLSMPRSHMKESDKAEAVNMMTNSQIRFLLSLALAPTVLERRNMWDFVIRCFLCKHGTCMPSPATILPTVKNKILLSCLLHHCTVQYCLNCMGPSLLRLGLSDSSFFRYDATFYVHVCQIAPERITLPESALD